MTSLRLVTEGKTVYTLQSIFIWAIQRSVGACAETTHRGGRLYRAPFPGMAKFLAMVALGGPKPVESAAAG